MAGYPRATAALLVVLFIGVVSMVVIIGVNSVGPILDHGTTVQHVSGKIKQITHDTTGISFTATVGVKTMQFRCTSRCLTSVSHLQRHLNEKAPTDIYYKLDPTTGAPIAIDAD